MEKYKIFTKYSLLSLKPLLLITTTLVIKYELQSFEHGDKRTRVGNVGMQLLQKALLLL